MRLERPTVSIQNGLPISLVSARLKLRSSRSKNGFGAAGGSGPGGSSGDVEAEPAAGDLGDCLDVGVARIELEQVDHGGDVGDHGLGQPRRHLLPVLLHEDEGDQRLEQHDRGDDDDQRAGEQALRHQVAQAAREAPPYGADAAERLETRLGRRRSSSVPLRVPHA